MPLLSSRLRDNTGFGLIMHYTRIKMSGSSWVHFAGRAFRSVIMESVRPHHRIIVQLLKAIHLYGKNEFLKKSFLLFMQGLNLTIIGWELSDLYLQMKLSFCHFLRVLKE